MSETLSSSAFAALKIFETHHQSLLRLDDNNFIQFFESLNFERFFPIEDLNLVLVRIKLEQLGHIVATSIDYEKRIMEVPLILAEMIG